MKLLNTSADKRAWAWTLLALLGLVLCARPAVKALSAAGDRATDATPSAEAGQRTAKETAPPAPAPQERNGLFVAVGYGLRHLVSTDGITWQYDEEQADSKSDKNFELRGGTHGNGLILAVGGGSKTRVLATRDGKDWQDVNVSGDWMGDVAYGNDRFVGVGYQGAFHSRDGLQAWARAPVRPASWRRIVFGGGKFVAIGATHDATPEGWTATSADGLKWTTAKVADGKFPRNIAYGNGRFVVVGTHGLRESSTDGVTWQDRTLGDKEESLSSIVWAGDRFVAIGRLETNKLAPKAVAYTSKDGVEWKPLSAKQQSPLLICYGNNRFVGSYGGGLFYSRDAIEWSRAETTNKTQISKIFYMESR